MSELAGKCSYEPLHFGWFSAIIAIVAFLPKKKRRQILLNFGWSVWYIPLPNYSWSSLLYASVATWEALFLLPRAPSLKTWGIRQFLICAIHCAHTPSKRETIPCVQKWYCLGIRFDLLGVFVGAPPSHGLPINMEGPDCTNYINLMIILP